MLWNYRKDVLADRIDIFFFFSNIFFRNFHISSFGAFSLIGFFSVFWVFFLQNITEVLPAELTSSALAAFTPARPMRNTPWCTYPDDERWDGWGAQGFQLASERPYCRQRPELELSLAQQVEKEPVLPAPGAGSARRAGKAGDITPRYKFTYKGWHSHVLLFLIFTFSPKGDNMSKYNSFSLATWIVQMVAMLPYLVTERPECSCHPLAMSGQICGSRAACICSANAGGLSCTAAVLLKRGGEVWGCVCSCSVKPVSFAGDGEEGGGCGVLSCASQGSSRSSNECIQGSNHHDWFMR